MVGESFESVRIASRCRIVDQVAERMSASEGESSISSVFAGDNRLVSEICCSFEGRFGC